VLIRTYDVPEVFESYNQTNDTMPFDYYRFEDTESMPYDIIDIEIIQPKLISNFYG
jgi:hypothetical protein